MIFYQLIHCVKEDICTCGKLHKLVNQYIKIYSMLLGNPLYVQLACKVGSSFNGLVILTTMLTWSSDCVSMGSMKPMEFQRLVP